MALIENLEHDDWRSFLESSFDLALELLATDRFRWAGSSVDDLKGWLAIGGMRRVKAHLNMQMRMRQFSLERTVAVNDALNQLAKENQRQTLDLMAAGIIDFDRKEFLGACGLSVTEFEHGLQLILNGGNPFEEWMRSHNRSEAEIAEVYQAIDNWLIQNN